MIDRRTMVAATAALPIAMAAPSSAQAGRPAGQNTGARRLRFAVSNGHKLAFYEAGSGPAVLLIHGNPDSAQLWRHQIAPLVQAGHRVITYDLLGCGASDRPPETQAYAQSRDVAGAWAVADALGIDNFYAVVGHDRGCGVAWGMAIETPRRVGRLIAMGAGHPAGGVRPSIGQLEKSWYGLRFQFPDAEDYLRRDNWRMLREWLRHHPETDSWIADLSRPGGLAAMLSWYRANWNPLAPRPAVPRSVSIPVVGLWSTGDAYLGEDQMLASERHVTGGWRYVRLEAAGHFMQLDRPDEVSRILIEAMA